MKTTAKRAKKDAVADACIRAARECLAEGMHVIEHCLSQLKDEQIWWRPRAEMNSVANLILHLDGNIRQWIVSGVGGAPDHRDRPAEFADRSHRPKHELLSQLKATVAEADAAIEKVPHNQLTQIRRIQGFDRTVLDALWHAIPHFRGHVQEIVHMTRELVGPAYKVNFVPQGKEQGAPE